MLLERFINKRSFETRLLIKLKRKAAKSEKIEYISQFSSILLTSRVLKWQLRYLPCQFPSLQHRNLLRLGPRSLYELQEQDNLFLHKLTRIKKTPLALSKTPLCVDTLPRPKRVPSVPRLCLQLRHSRGSYLVHFFGDISMSMSKTESLWTWLCPKCFHRLVDSTFWPLWAKDWGDETSAVWIDIVQ